MPTGIVYRVGRADRDRVDRRGLAGLQLDAAAGLDRSLCAVGLRVVVRAVLTERHDEGEVLLRVARRTGDGLLQDKVAGRQRLRLRGDAVGPGRAARRVWKHEEERGRGEVLGRRLRLDGKIRAEVHVRDRGGAILPGRAGVHGALGDVALVGLDDADAFLNRGGVRVGTDLDAVNQWDEDGPLEEDALFRGRRAFGRAGRRTGRVRLRLCGRDRALRLRGRLLLREDGVDVRDLVEIGKTFMNTCSYAVSVIYLYYKYNCIR